MRSPRRKRYILYASVFLCTLFFAHASFAQNVIFSKMLMRGFSGADVQKLQVILMTSPIGGTDIYPEAITSGYFGILTEKAVKRFQAKYGIEPLGMLGPKTRAKLNELITGKKEAPKMVNTPVSQLQKCPTPTATGCQKTNVANAFDPSGGKCEGTGAVQFGASPFRLDQLELIEPMGSTVGGHVTPIDHGYMFGHGTPDVLPDTFDIQSPAKGYVIDISRTQRGDFSDYAMTIEFSCTHYIKYSNMTSFAPKLLQAAGGSIGPNEIKNFRMPVAEGELVGKTGAFGIDLYVWDLNKKLTGFINPKSYSTESWKIYSAQFFDYVKEPLKTQLLAKDLRQLEPRFGKIDYDIDGRLVGTWFEKDTNGYAGLHSGEGYWAGHLSIAYDALDPFGIIVSIGNWAGTAAQFGVRGNAPDPKDVRVETGLVKYELLQLNWIEASTGKQWTRRNYIPDPLFRPIDTGANSVKGVLLLQLMESRILKLETFPGKTAAEVSGFTPAARLYER